MATTSSPQISFDRHFDQFVTAAAKGRRLTVSGKRICSGTVRNYRFTQKLLLEYQENYGVSLRIQLLHKASLRILQKEKNYWVRFFCLFSGFLYNAKGYGDHYVNGVFKILRTFFNYLQAEKGYMVGNYHKAFRIPLLQAPPVVLQPWQLHFLITDKQFEASLSPALKRVKDIFVVGCTVALRFSDLMSLQRSNLVCLGNETSLVLNTQKTGSRVRIPLPGYVMDIIDHYERKAGKYLLPRLASSNMNLQVKKLVKQAGWDQCFAKNISCRGKMKELRSEAGGTWKFYQHITAHTMRRTAITTLLMLGVPENMVRKVSGHAPGSKEFYKYVSIAQEYLDQEIKKAHKKLLEGPSNPYDIG